MGIFARIMVVAPPIGSGCTEDAATLGGFMAGAEVRERRAKPSTPLVRECRLCWRAVELDRRFLEVTDQHAYVRCGHCGGSFPIRRRDLEALAPAKDLPSADS